MRPDDRPPCPHCGGKLLKSGTPTRPYRCRECRKRVSLDPPPTDPSPPPVVPPNRVRRRVKAGWDLALARSHPLITRGQDNPHCPQCGKRLYSHPKSRPNGKVKPRWRCKPCRKIYPA